MAIQLRFMSYTLSKQELGVATVTDSKEVGDQIPLMLASLPRPKSLIARLKALFVADAVEREALPRA